MVFAFSTPSPAAAQGQSDVEAARFFSHAAACAAALQAVQLALVAQARAGAPQLRSQIVNITRLGFTFVGVAYKRGLRNPKADKLLDAARAEQKAWPTERHAALVAQCPH